MAAKRGHFQGGSDVPEGESVIARRGDEMPGLVGEPADVEDGVVVGIELFDASLRRRKRRVEDADFAIFVGDGEMSLRRRDGKSDDEGRNRDTAFVA